MGGWTDFSVTLKQFLENEFLVFHSGDHEWKKLIMVHHWPTTVCMVSVSVLPRRPLDPGKTTPASGLWDVSPRGPQAGRCGSGSRQDTASARPCLRFPGAVTQGHKLGDSERQERVFSVPEADV